MEDVGKNCRHHDAVLGWWRLPAVAVFITHQYIWLDSLVPEIWLAPLSRLESFSHTAENMVGLQQVIDNSALVDESDPIKTVCD